jgi:DNA-binding MarR family transcriptional regulator
MPSAISKTALANIHCLVATGVKEKADAVALAGAMLLDEEQRDTLGRLPLGTAIARVQRKGVPDAFMLRLPLVPLQKGSILDDQVRAFMTPHIQPAEQPAETAKNAPSKLTASEMAFLKDAALVPDSGVVARYTRLGLSGRQGDKTKRALIEAGLIEETEKITHSGRTRVVRLTEKGLELVKRIAGIQDQPGEER